MNKENWLNEGLHYAAAFAAANAGRNRRDVDWEGLERPPMLTELYQPFNVLDENAVTPPEPEFTHATQA
jgi:hypothetical protein